MFIREFGMLGIRRKVSQLQFNLEVRCICALYARLLGPYKNDVGMWKIEVECHQESMDDGMLPGPDIATIRRQFDFDEYEILDNQNKKIIILSLLQEGVEEVCSFYKWSPLEFRKVYNEIIELEYRNEWFLRKKFLNNRSRNFQANLICLHEIDLFQTKMIVKNKQGEEVCNQVVAEEIPDEFVFDDLLGTVKWEKESRVSSISKGGEIIKSIDITSNH